MKKRMKQMYKKIVVSGLLAAMVCNQIIPASAAMGQVVSEVAVREETKKVRKASPSEAEEATPSNGRKDILLDEYDYCFDENMILNSDFSEGEDNWNIVGGGIAGNNPNMAGSGGKHFYLDSDGNQLSQSIRVPYTGYYRVSAWIAAPGSGNKLGVKNGETDRVIEELSFGGESSYTQYEAEVFLEKGDLAEVYVISGGSWVNGDDVALSYVTSKFPNMAVNGDFKGNGGWNLHNAEISGGKAVLPDEDSSISQVIYIPQDGPYFAEVKVEGAEDASVSYGGAEETGIFGDETIRILVPELMRPEETELIVSGRTSVKSVKVQFDLENMKNTAPLAEDIQLSGETITGNTITASYHFTDADGHVEGNSQYMWMTADTEDGDYDVVEGENETTITLKEEFEDKFLKFKVTPVDQFQKAGAEAVSEAVGPVRGNLIQNPGFEQKRTGWSGVTIRDGLAHTGKTRGIVPRGKNVYQDIVVKKSGVYQFTAYTRYKGSETGKAGIMDKSGTVLLEIEIGGAEEYVLAEAPIILEKGQEIRVFFDGASDADYDIDDVGLIIDKDAPIPVLHNIVAFNVDNKNVAADIFRNERRVNIHYRYGTDVSAVILKELVLSEGASASVESGAALNLKEPFEIVVTGSDGTIQVWTVTSEEEEKQVYLESSNQNLEENFNWAAKKQRQFVMTGKSGVINKDEQHPEGDGSGDHEYIPSYWAGYYHRSAFYSRDFVHQATGGQIAGLAEENYSMFSTFAKQCTEARKWYTVWAINFDGSPHTIDYKDDNNFVREVPAQFELVEKAYEQYLWSGDDRYISDEMFEFYTRVMTDYVELHDTQLTNGVAEGTGKGIFDGSCTYNERGGEHPIEAGDALGSQYQAMLAYAGILTARGDEEGAAEWYQKAAELKHYFNNNWSKNPAGELANYARAIEDNGRKFYDFGKENSWFMPLKMITEPGERNDRYIDFIIENLGGGIGSPGAPTNLEAYTYIPDMLFLYNRSDEAWKWMKYITSIKDEPHEVAQQGTNGDYPEISFTYVSHTIEGMMGVEPDARVNFVATAPRLPKEVDDVTAKYITIGDIDIDLTHMGNQYTAIRNHSDEELTWEPRFYGNFGYIRTGGDILPARHKEINGEAVSYVTVTVEPGEELSAETLEEEGKDGFKLESPKNGLTDVVTPITFIWTEEPWATSYKMVVSENESFEGDAVVMEEEVDGTAAVCKKELKPGSTYYWKVEAICGTTEEAVTKTSEIWNFCIKKESSPDPEPTPEPDPEPTPDRPSRSGSHSAGSTAVEGTWKLDTYGWWYRYTDGTYPKNGWAYLNYEGKYNWYYFDENGYMADGWITSGNQKYYLSTTSNGTRGQMYTGWHLIEGKWYYFNMGESVPVGALLVNTTTPDGYTVGSDGSWVPQAD